MQFNKNFPQENYLYKKTKSREHNFFDPAKLFRLGMKDLGITAEGMKSHNSV